MDLLNFTVKQLYNNYSPPIRKTNSNAIVRRNKSSHSINYQNCTKVNKWLTVRGVVTRWVPLSACVYGIWLYKRGINEDVTNIELEGYTHLPLRIVSKLWGGFANLELPKFMRNYVYGKYSRAFKVNMEEAAVHDLAAYSSLGAFFTRELKPDVRVVDQTGCLVSPCDGKILHCGPATSATIEQVKGVTYTLEEFFGENTWNNNSNEYSDYYESIMKNSQDNILHHCVIYLAPGDYHRFHSPCDWKASFRRHFSGKLLSVNPIFAKLIPGLFCLNERAVYVGEWKYGFFSFTPVGATNVGSIDVYKDKQLKTNKRKLKHTEDLLFEEFDLQRGEMTGQFNMGSTIVLIFEAPKNFKFILDDGDKIKMGQKLGCLKK